MKEKDMKKVTVYDKTGKHLVVEIVLGMTKDEIFFRKFFKASWSIYLGKLMAENVTEINEEHSKWLLDIMMEEKNVLGVIKATEGEVCDNFDRDFKLVIKNYKMPNTIDGLMDEMGEKEVEQ